MSAALEPVCAALLFAAVGTYRYLSLAGFSDDHFVSLVGAQQMLHGAWPSRDFVDPGEPLTFLVTAGAQAALGRGLFAEAVLVSMSFAVAAVVTMRATVMLTGSVALGLAAAGIEVLVYPRSYSHPKMVVYSVAALLLAGYAKTPTPVRCVGLALISTVAFLVRHDHGPYVALAALVAASVSPADGGRRARSVGLFLVGGLLFALPYVAYVQVAGGGFLAHVSRGLDYMQLEAERQRLTLRGMPTAWAWLLGTLWAAPVAAVAIAASRAVADRTGERRRNLGTVVPLATLALAANWGMIRDDLRVRLPDPIVVPAILLACVVAWAWTTQSRARWLTRAGSLAALLVTLAAAASLGSAAEQVDRIGRVDSLDGLLTRFDERTRELEHPWTTRQVPSAAAGKLAPFFDYAPRCLAVEDRLLVPGFLPEVASLAGRPFAGGQVWFLAGAMRSPEDHALVMRRLSRERVPVVVVRYPHFNDLASEFPALASYVRRFTPIAEWSLGGDDRLVLGADAALARGTDGSTGWPCFVSPESAVRVGWAGIASGERTRGGASAPSSAPSRARDSSPRHPAAS